MTSDERSLSRRRLLEIGGGAAASAAMLSLGGLGGVSRARAAETAVSFQLSWIKSIQYGGYFAGIDQGIYRKAGIDPTFVSGGPNVDPVANVASGRSQIGDRPIGPLIVARDKGIPIKVIGTVFQKSPYSIISLAKTPIRTVKDMVGKTIATATSGRPMILYMIKEAGIDPASVNLVPSAPDPSALVSGQIDGYAGYSTNQGVMLKTRGVDIVTLNAHDIGLPETTGTIYAREDFLKDNRDLVVKFLRASAESWRWALANPEATAKLMVEKYGNPGLVYDAQLAEIQESKPFIEAGPAATKGLLTLDMDLFGKIIALYRSVGLVKGDMKAADLCDPSFAEAAAKA